MLHAWSPALQPAECPKTDAHADVLLQKEVCKELGWRAFRIDIQASMGLCEKLVQGYLGKPCASECWPIVGQERYQLMVSGVSCTLKLCIAREA